jgi:hypothetical protein
MDAAFLNTVANHPDVRPFLGGAGELDLSGFTRPPENFAFEFEHGGIIFQKLEHGVYEGHSMFLPEGRGERVKEAMAESIRWMFARTDCLEIVTKCPDANKATIGAARNMGFTKGFRLDRGWPLPDGEYGGVECMRLTLAKWIERDEMVEPAGHWFHERLEELTTEAGKPIPKHYDEPAHNRAVGASVLMFQAGNALKGATSYNLWARIAGFPVIRVLSINPVVIDMDQAVVGIADGDMEVLLCRSGS